MTPKEDQQPMTTREELVARELLAKEYDVGGHDGAYPTYAALARDPNNKGAFTMCSIRAVAAALRLASRQEVSVTVEELATLLIDCWKSGKAPLQVARALLAEYSITKRTTEG